jgi:hypothetical protein
MQRIDASGRHESLANQGFRWLSRPTANEKLTLAPVPGFFLMIGAGLNEGRDDGVQALWP